MTAPRHYQRATTAELARVRAMVASGATWDRIGAATGRTEQAARCVGYRHGIKKRKPAFNWTLDAVRTLATMKKQGAKNREIAAALGCDEHSVWYRWGRILKRARVMRESAR